MPVKKAAGEEEKGEGEGKKRVASPWPRRPRAKAGSLGVFESGRGKRGEEGREADLASLISGQARPGVGEKEEGEKKKKGGKHDIGWGTLLGRPFLSSESGRKRKRKGRKEGRRRRNAHAALVFSGNAPLCRILRSGARGRKGRGEREERRPRSNEGDTVARVSLIGERSFALAI